VIDAGAVPPAWTPALAWPSIGNPREAAGPARIVKVLAGALPAMRRPGLSRFVVSRSQSQNGKFSLRIMPRRGGDTA
jgi:hypothetical protein